MVRSDLTWNLVRNFGVTLLRFEKWKIEATNLQQQRQYRQQQQLRHQHQQQRQNYDGNNDNDTNNPMTGTTIDLREK